MPDETRREILKLLAAAGALTGLGGVGTVAAGDRSDDDDDDATVDSLTENGNGVPTSRVRVGHLIADAGAVDLYAFVAGRSDLGQARLYRGLEFGTVLPDIPAEYVDIPAVELGLRITPSGDPDTTLIEMPSFTFEDDVNYTILATGELTAEDDEPGPEALVLVDNADEEPPEYGRTQLPNAHETSIRFVHALPGAGEVSIEAGERTLVEEVAFGDATDYIDVDPSCTLRITAGGETLATITGDLRRATRYTVAIVDATPDGDPTPDIVATVDAVAEAGLVVEDGGH